MPGIIGKKLGMTRLFQDDGSVIPVTVLHCQPATVTYVKTAERDGYPAIVLGFDALKKPRKTKKFKLLREFRVEKPEDFKIGDMVTVDTFKDIKDVTVTGMSKGKGFMGTMRRHNFHSGPGGHGSHFKREPGSIGARSKPGRIHKGKKMAGHQGYDRITLKNIPLVEIDSAKHLLLVKGPVPGPDGGVILIKA